MNTKAVFIDKDGTLVENVPYNVDPEQIRLAEGALEGVRRLHAAGYRLFVVSNQSGVARGEFSIEALAPVKAQLEKLLAEAQAPLAGFYFCPHHPEGRRNEYAIECFCRKPRPGMLFQAAREHGINLADSWMVGDILDDIEAGRRAGCSTILVDNGGETLWQTSPLRQPNHRVTNMLQAAQVILGQPISDSPQPVSRPALRASNSPAQPGIS